MVAQLLISPFDHPYIHLSIEEYLLKHVALAEPIVLLYVNRPSIIVGRNQNPWLECDIHAMKSKGIILGRRISGGGAVYHDYGNLNYAVFYRQKTLDASVIFNWIQQTFLSLGIELVVGQRKELLYKNYKISGTAFGRFRDRTLHHGTLLIQTDQQLLKDLLLLNPLVISGRSVASVPSQVTNLGDHNDKITVETVVERLTQYTEGLKTTSAFLMEEIMKDSIFRTIMEKHQSWQWLYGETPQFKAALPGNSETHFTVTHGRLQTDNPDIRQSIHVTFPDVKL